MDETFTPPAGVRAEARRALEWMKEGEAGGGFTSVGRRRASQLAAGQPVSIRTLRRMRSYLARHGVDSQGEGYKPGQPGYPSPGRVAWAAWGGDAGRSWVNRVLRSVDAQQKADKPSPDREQALRVARMMGCRGAHQGDDGTWMPCATHEEMLRISNRAESVNPENDPEFEGKGRRRKGRKRKPNGWENLDERPIPVGGIESLPGGGVVAAHIATKAEKRKARRDRLAATPAPASDRVQGSSRNRPGSAASTRGGIQISAATTEALREKVRIHNESVTEAWKRTTLGALESVYRRGAGAFSVSHRPGMTRGQWAMGRVNAFLKILKSGRPGNSRYVGDNDLLPEGHPWKKKTVGK